MVNEVELNDIKIISTSPHWRHSTDPTSFKYYIKENAMKTENSDLLQTFKPTIDAKKLIKD